jgi:hypothetical protein
MKIPPVGAELFHASGRTDRHDKAYILFSLFCEYTFKNAYNTSEMKNISP